MHSNFPAIQLLVAATAKTPEIIYNKAKGEISITGKSLPEGTEDFYNPVFSLLQNFISVANSDIKITIDLEYINTSSCTCLLNFIKNINHPTQKGKGITVDWLYEEGDNDMKEKSKIFQEVINFPINAVLKLKRY